MTKPKQPPHRYANLVQSNIALGQRNRMAVWNAIQSMGLDPHGKIRAIICEATGINHTTVSRCLKEIRSGWRPE